jgi:predicted transcriptional regulator
MESHIESTLLSFVLVSKHRISILRNLNKSQITPTLLAKKLGLGNSHTSVLLKGLYVKELIICINPDKKKGRLYEITDNGKIILAKVNSILSDF